jgi:hypothetical protein
MLCGDGFMDFIHRPKGKILKSQRLGIGFCFRPQVLEGEKRRTPVLLGPLEMGQWWRLALYKGPNRIGVLNFSPSIHLRTEAEPASETLWF